MRRSPNLRVRLVETLVKLGNGEGFFKACYLGCLSCGHRSVMRGEKGERVMTPSKVRQRIQEGKYKRGTRCTKCGEPHRIGLGQ